MDFRTIGTSLFAAGGFLALLHSGPGTQASLPDTTVVPVSSLLAQGSTPTIEIRSPDQFRQRLPRPSQFASAEVFRERRTPGARPKPLAGLRTEAATVTSITASAIKAALPASNQYPSTQVTPARSMDGLSSLMDLPTDHSQQLADSSQRIEFSSSAITGFLQPDGFSRPQWDWLSNAVHSLTERLRPQKTKPQFIVMLDAGHGGSDPGAKAPNGLLEKDLTLDIAKRVRLFLSEFDDITVKLTREIDRGLSRHNRVELIQRSQADIVLSLHLNHLPQTDLTLVESFYAAPRNIAESMARQELQKRRLTKTQASASINTSSPDLDFTKGSERLARLVQGRLFNEVKHGNPEAQNAGIKADTLFVLTRSFIPGALVEMTVLSNSQEAERLSTEAYRNQLAAAIADSIRDYRDSLKNSPIPRALRAWEPETCIPLCDALIDSAMKTSARSQELGRLCELHQPLSHSWTIHFSSSSQ